MEYRFGHPRRRKQGWFTGLLRFLSFHPALVAALLLALYVAIFTHPHREIFEGASHRPANLNGWICDLPQFYSDYMRIPVRVEQAHQNGNEISIPGTLYIYCPLKSPSSPPFDPPLEYGESVELSTYVRGPNYFSVPGVPDYRLIASLQGAPFRCSLKSPLQLVRKGVSTTLKARLLQPVFAYLQAFERQCLDVLSDENAKVVLSSFIGKKSFLEQSELRAIRQIGALHLFVVSGFHIGVLLSALHLLLGRAGWKGSLVCLTLMWLYILGIGTPLSALRAGIIASAAYPIIALGCRINILNLLGFSAILILLDSTRHLFSVGFQLSFLCLLALCLGAVPLALALKSVQLGVGRAFTDVVELEKGADASLGRRSRFFTEKSLAFLPPSFSTGAKHLIRLLQYPLLLLISTLAIQVFVLPLIVHLQNRLNPIVLIANLVLIPLFTVLIPITLIFFLTFWLPNSEIMSKIIEPVATAIRIVIDFLDHDSVFFYFPQPTGMEFFLYFSILAILVLLLPRRYKVLILFLPLLLLVSLTLSTSPEDQKELIVTLLDVDQGDSIHLRYPNGANGLIDTGGLAYHEPKSLVGERVVARYLWKSRTDKLDFLLITHPETDHFGGYPFLVKAFDIRQLFYSLPDSSYREPKKQLLAGRTLRIGKVSHEVIHPEKIIEFSDEKNDQSLVVRLDYRSFSMLFTGDIGKRVEADLVKHLAPVTVLKAGHHGSKYSSGGPFLDALSPQLALMSAGRRNPFGHPSPEALQRMRSRSILPFSTSRWGTLRIRTNGSRLILEHYSIEKGEFIEILRRKLSVPDG